MLFTKKKIQKSKQDPPKAKKKFPHKIELTRVYLRLDGNVVRKQPVTVSKDSIEHIRPRNKLEGNRCSVFLKSGKVINVAETYEEVNTLWN